MILLLLTLAVVPASRAAWSQDVPPQTVEAPPTLFTTSLGGTQASLGISGSWNADLAGSLGFGLDTSGGGLFPASFPGMTEGFNFQQVPNLNISLGLLDRFFFQTSFLDTSGSQPSSLPLGLNAFVLGYNGRPNEFLQSVRIGNSSVNMADYNYLSFPAPSTSSIGASAKFRSGNGTYEAMVRYEPATLHRRVFIGHNEITEQRVTPGGFVDGQFFVLPDKDVQNITVYIEDGTGTLRASDGHLYRVAGPNDVAVSSANGTVAFRTPLAGRALVYYTKNGSPVGSASLGKGFLPATDPSTGALNLTTAPLDFNWNVANYPETGDPAFSASREVSVNGQQALLIYSPGEFSPFQADNVYALGSNLPAADTVVHATLVPNGSDGIQAAGTGTAGAASYLNLPNGTALRISLDATEQSVSVLGFATSGTQPTIDPRSIAGRYPFTDLPSIYLPGPGRSAQNTSDQILLRMWTPVNDYELDTNILPGSLRVLRNGRSDTNYTLDYSTGILAFTTPIADSDVLLISYRTSDTTTPGGDLLFGVGARFDLLPFLSFDVATGLRWSVFSGSYSTEEGTNTGSALLTAGLHFNQGKKEGLRGSLEAGLSLSSPDTTGAFRLFGMEGSGVDVSWLEGNMFPSSIPASTEFSTSPGSQFNFTAADRGELLYEDYHLYNAAGSTLQPITWPVPSSQQYPYSSGSYTGPYPVLDSTLGTVMVMDYRMKAGDWVGAQIPLSGAPENLSGAQSISFSINSYQPGSQIAAYIQIGAIGENLDGTGTLEESGSTTVKSFPFNDNGTVLMTAGGASPKSGGIYDSEDTNGNAILDLENSALVVTKPITVPSSAGWTQVQVNLSPADRQKLTNANAIRIVLVNTSGADIASKFLVSSFSIAESPFQVSAANPSATSVQEVSDPQPSGKQLEDLFPEVKTTFHPTGQPQKVLQVTWSGATTQPAWQLTGYPNPAPAGVYRRLDFYLLTTSLAAGASPTFTLNLTDASETGIHLSVPVAADDIWHKYSVDLTTGDVTRDGQKIAQTATLDSGASRYTVLTMSLSGASAGNFYIDEIHLSQATIQLSAGATLDAAFSKNGVVASLAGVPLLRDVSIHEQSSLTGANFASGFESYPDSTAIASYTEVAGRLPFANVALHVGVSHDASQTVLSGGHNVSLPLGPVTLSDTYSQTVDGTQMTFDHADQADVTLGSSFTADVQDSANAIGPTLTQALQVNAASRPPGPFSLSMNSTLSNQIERYSPASLEYFPNWAASYRLLAPVSEDDAVRSGTFQLANVLALGSKSRPVVVRLSLQPSGSYQSDLTTSRTQTDVGALSLSLPIVFTRPAANNLSITPSYTRQFSSSVGSLPNQNFSQDLSTYAGSVAGAAYFYDSLPFAELFSSNELSIFTQATAGLQSASYEPGVSVTIARKSGSYLSDLLLPTNLVFGLSRTLARSGDTVTDTHDWEVEYGTDALNLFGRAGAYPVFPFYRTEEIATNIDVKSITDGVSSVLQNLITLYFGGNQQLQLDHRLDLTWDPTFQVSDNATLSFVYRPRLHIFLPFVPRSLQQGDYLVNTESATVATTPDTTQNALQVNLDHETSIVLPGHGTINAKAGVGVAENLISAGQRRILFGIQASLGAQLAF